MLVRHPGIPEARRNRQRDRFMVELSLHRTQQYVPKDTHNEAPQLFLFSDTYTTRQNETHENVPWDARTITAVRQQKKLTITC